MKNMGITDLALVDPRHFPHEDATARASGADDVLEQAVVYESLQQAISDCVYVAGASARSRAINWPCMEPRECAATLHDQSARGTVAVVFGPEKSGLSNADLDHCDTLLTIPANPAFSSLNLAMAVQVIAYEWRLAGESAPLTGYEPDAPPATSEELEYFYAHLEEVLTEIGFLNVNNPRTLMRRLRRLFVRAHPDKNEVNILRGILTAVERTRASND
jgi:TrmH family RNA methyltransferase